MSPDHLTDLSDLDLLNDPVSHARCAICTGYADLPFGTIYEAICGKRAIIRHNRPIGYIPPNACPDCVRLDCSRCGS